MSHQKSAQSPPDPTTLPSDINYGNTVNGVLYELIDNLTTDNQARIKGRQLIDKALASQVAAEYKQLLNELPEKQLELMNVETKAAYYNDGWNFALDQCRAIIQAKIKEME